MVNAELAIDLIAFSGPSCRETEPTSQVVAPGVASPRRFWDLMLDAITGLRITGNEAIFAPMDWELALDASSSVQKLTAELQRRGIALTTDFFANVATVGDHAQPSAVADPLGHAHHYVDFFGKLDVDIMVMRHLMFVTWDSRPPLSVDLIYASQLGDLGGQMDAMWLQRRIRVALHPNTHLAFSTRHKIDLLILLTDLIHVGFCSETTHTAFLWKSSQCCRSPSRPRECGALEKRDRRSAARDHN